MNNPTDQTTFLARLSQIQKNIDGFSPVTLVAVTKYATYPQMHWALKAGIKHFGENKIQLALEKQAYFEEQGITDIQWHFIGHLQSNKAKQTVGRFSLIHSVDSVKLATLLSKANNAQGTVQSVLLQLNTSGEESKYGFSVNELRQAFKDLAALTGIRIQGLMTMAPNTQDENVIKATFEKLKAEKRFFSSEYNIDLPELSMGMSNDYGHALKLDATIIRLGSILFDL